jgi:HupH hydrogenase expression protein
VSRLNDIPIRIEPPARTGGLGGGVTAILSELANLLVEVAKGGAPTSVDLRSLPMSPQDRTELQSALGTGEVRATLDADGLSTLRETSVSGIWWIEHRNGEGELIAELIEVTPVPQILQSIADDMATSARELRERITAGAPRAIEGSEHATRQ